MRSILLAVLYEIRKAEHTKGLLEKYQLLIRVICDGESWFMKIDGKNSTLLSVEDKASDVVIEGSEETLKLLFNGEDFLLAMQRREDIDVEGSLKHLLWLEALLYICKVSER